MPRFTPDFIDELKARLRPSDVIGRHVKLKKQGREWGGLSPFTKEKTPSFFVNDEKGFYHCFSSGKHGDIIGFLQETQKLSFAEAVTRLAEEAGLPIPEDRPGEAESAERRKGLVEACEAAAGFFQATLRRAPGRAAADYLAGRGVASGEIDEFRIGYAPAERTALKDYLINKGYAEETLLEAGLLVKPEEGGAAYDRFRHRVMFPILGPKGAVIAFGGRALEKDAKAKYLNSPETPLFHKGAVLYNHAAARAAALDSGKPALVCEGYLDVIALWSAGFRTAVAPLGTALTEQQLDLLWRMSDEPVLCFDGDRAGLGAAYRAIDRALPLLKPGRSLSFAFMPEGQDPDDLVRAGGATAMSAALDRAEPLAGVLWRRETESRPLDTPERRAALRADLRKLVHQIADKDVRSAYGADYAARLQERFAPAPRPKSGSSPAGRSARGAGGGSKGKRRDPREEARLEARPSADLKRRGGPSAWRREATLVLAAVRHPALVERKEEAFLALHLEDKGLAAVLGEILKALSLDPGLDSDGLKAHLQRSPAGGPLERLLLDETLNQQRFLRPEAGLDEVDRGWSDALRLHVGATRAARETPEAAARLFNDGEEVWKAAATAAHELRMPADDGEAAEGELSSKDLSDALDRMRASVKARKGR